MNLIDIRELPVVGYMPYQQEYPCFALPLLAHPKNDSVKAIQEIDEISEAISGFKVLEDVAPNASSANGPLVKVGERPVHCFITEIGEPHIGTLHTLEQTLKAFTVRCPAHTAVILQILELIGTEPQKKIFRAKMRAEISGAAGDRAAYAFYERSTLRAAFWHQLLVSAPDPEAARRILKVRPQLDASIDANGNIGFDLTALDPNDRARIDQQKLTASLIAEFAPSSDHVKTNEQFDLDLKPEILTQDGQISELLGRIRATGRQEERIAILADAILQNRDVGISALIQYQGDRAKVANWAVQEMRGLLSSVPSQSQQHHDEMYVAELVPRLFTHHYPLSRGQLLFYLAKHLGKWPLVNQALRRSLDRSNSIFVDNYRDQIDNLLRQARAQNKTAPLTPPSVDRT